MDFESYKTPKSPQRCAEILDGEDCDCVGECCESLENIELGTINY